MYFYVKYFKFSILNELKTRGVQAVYPFAKIQRYIIHQLRASIKYIPYKDRKAFASDLKGVYGAINEDVALENLMEAKEKWEKKYSNAIKSWEDNWGNIVTFLAFPDYIRRIMYTTNAIESLNIQFRKATKTKLIFPNDESLLKMLYLAT